MRRKITPEYLASQGLSENFPERFWKKVRKTKGCWFWTGAKLLYGYGRISHGFGLSSCISAHVASWIMHRGPVPKGLCVLHDCPGGDRTDCVNPKHLWIGTNGDNSKDMAKKRRSAIGERNGQSKLTAIQVSEIRKRYVKGNRTAFKGNSHLLASEFGVTISAINQIARKVSWKHVT